MQLKFLLLLASFALTTGIPKDERSLSAESESDESEERHEPADTTTAQPESKIIVIKNAFDLNTRIAEASDKLVVIYFMVTWCPFCRKINPTVEDIASTTENLIVVKVDRDNLEEGKDGWKYGLSNLPSVPRFIFVKNGKKVEELQTSSDSVLRDTVTKVMLNGSSNSSD